MNIFFRELKANRKALIIWCICMVLLVISGMGKYTAYSGGGAASEALNELPSSVRALFGFSAFDVTKMTGFYALLFLYLEIAVAIHAVLLGNGIIAKEERDKTTEFLMAKPVSRLTVILSKLLAAVVNVLILNLVSLFSSIAIVASMNKEQPITGEIVFFHISMILVQLIFLSLGAFLAAAIRNPKASGSLSVTILLTSYILSKITDISVQISFLNILSPFKYFDYETIINQNTLDIIIVLLSMILIGALSVSAYRMYQKRNLNV